MGIKLSFFYHFCIVHFIKYFLMVYHLPLFENFIFIDLDLYVVLIIEDNITNKIFSIIDNNKPQIFTN